MQVVNLPDIVKGHKKAPKGKTNGYKEAQNSQKNPLRPFVPFLWQPIPLFCQPRYQKQRLLGLMDPTATSEFIAVSMESPVVELEDFTKVVEVYWHRIFRFILASVRDADAASTLTQDCFWRAYRGRNRFRGDASVNTWLMQIAVNLVRDYGRNRRLQFWKRAFSSSVDTKAISDWLADGSVTPEMKTVMKEQVDAVWAATVALSERQRTVFLLRFVEDMELLEIAAATGLTEGSVKVHLFRAVQSVRKQVRSLK